NIRSYTGTSWNGNNSTGLRVSTIDYMDAKRSLITIGRQDDGSVTSDDDGLTWRVHFCCDGLGTAISDEFNELYWYDVNKNVHLAPFCCSTSGVTNDVLVTKLHYDRFSDQVFSLYDDKTNTRVLHRAANGVGTWTQDNYNVPSGLVGLAAREIDGRSIYAFGGRWIYDLVPVAGVWQAGAGTPFPSSVTSVYASREQPLEAWATLAGNVRVAHTTDGWRTWTDISGVDPQDPMRHVISPTAIVAVPFQRNELYVATTMGVV